MHQVNGRAGRVTSPERGKTGSDLSSTFSHGHNYGLHQWDNFLNSAAP